MVGMDSKFHEGQKVRLRSDIDTTIYGDFACAGNEGWILKYRTDKFDLPEVLVQWDKNHWTYNGVQDGWTFEDHFEPVEEMTEPDKQQQLDTLLQSFGEGLKAIMGGQDIIKDDKPKRETPSVRNLLASSEEEPDPEQDYRDAVQVAVDHLNEAEGFVVLGVSRQDHPEAKDGMLVPFALASSKTMESELLLGAHMAHLAAREHQALTVQAIHAISSHDDK